MEDCCVVCAEPLEWVAYGSCGHKDVCSTCIARLRFVLNDKRCCICKQECPRVFVTKAAGEFTKVIGDFEALPSKLNSKPTDLWYESSMEAYFDDEEQFKMMKAMFRLSCSVCEEAEDTLGKEGSRKPYVFRNLDLLRKHLYHGHRLHMCDLCLEGRKIFLCEQNLFTRGQLDRHMKGQYLGDVDLGFTGHPLCEFCKRRFYGENELYQHMSTEHFTCHICQRQRPEKFDYFRNYDDLEAHFRHDHFLCDDQECLAKKFVVFISEAELKRHNAIAHGGNLSRAQRNAALQIPASFQYRSFRPNRPVDGFPRRGGRVQFIQSEEETSTSVDVDAESTHLETVIRDSLSLVTETRPAVSENSNRIAENNSSSAMANSTDEVEDDEINSNPAVSSDISRYVSAVTGTAPSSLRQAVFPPLPSSSQSGQKKENQSSQSPALSMAARLAGERGYVKVINPPRPRIDSTPETIFRESSPETSTTWPELSTAKPQSMPLESNGVGSSAAIERNRSNGIITNLSKDEIRVANKALVEQMKEGLHHDEAKFNALKDASIRFTKGEVDAKVYIKQIFTFGLSHLVPEMARLCPDPVKQNALLEAYQEGLKNKDNNLSSDISVPKNNRGKLNGKNLAYANSTSSGVEKSNEVIEVLSKDGYRDAKGKSKVTGSNSATTSLFSGKDAVRSNTAKVLIKARVPLEEGSTWTCNICTLENTSGNRCLACGMMRADVVSDNPQDSRGTEKRKKKGSKFQKMRLGEAASLLETRENPWHTGQKSEEDADSVSNGGSSLIQGVWKNRGGQRLLPNSHREAP